MEIAISAVSRTMARSQLSLGLAVKRCVTAVRLPAERLSIGRLFTYPIFVRPPTNTQALRTRGLDGWRPNRSRRTASLKRPRLSGSIHIRRLRSQPLFGASNTTARNLRRPGGHCDRECSLDSEQEAGSRDLAALHDVTAAASRSLEIKPVLRTKRW